MELVVAKIGAPHGLQGMARLEVRTDDPATRLEPGTALATDPPGHGPLTVDASANRNGVWYARFAEAADRTAVEQLRGTLLLVTIDDDDNDEEDAWYAHQLVGLAVEHVDGRALGTVTAIEHPPAQDLLVVTEPDGGRALVPLVAEIVPQVDLEGRRIVLDPPRGLFAADPSPDDEA